MALLGPPRLKEVPWFGSPFFADIWDPFEIGVPDLYRKSDVDWRETDKAHIFQADLPGVQKEDMKVQVEDGNILQISGKRSEERDEKTTDGDKWHRAERPFGDFLRRFRLPENADVDKAKCELEDGVLTVKVPKKEAEESQKNARNVDVT